MTEEKSQTTIDQKQRERLRELLGGTALTVTDQGDIVIKKKTKKPEASQADKRD